MKKALLLYAHGIGDVIIATPVFRELYRQGYIVDLITLDRVRKSRLLDHCPYVDGIYEVVNPHSSSVIYRQQRAQNLLVLQQLKADYDWSAFCLHETAGKDKLDVTIKECGVSVTDTHLEVFIAPEIEKAALDYIKEHFPDGYIFRHTDCACHTYHDWDSAEWIRENLPALPVMDTGYKGEHKFLHGDINFSFVLAREAQHRVLSSSVFVHACEAMEVPMDIINYGRADRPVWPRNQDLVLRIREEGSILKSL